MSRRFSVNFALSFILAVSAFGQAIPTATLTGKVTTDDAPLPGVIVTVASPNLQGTRTLATSEAGDYLFPLLPPGDYTVRFELAGMQTVTRRITLTAARTDRIDLQMRPTTLAESITVTADAPMTAPLESTQVSSNMKHELVEKLPTERNLEAITLFSPGVNDNGPEGNIMISGAMSFENLFLVNGVVVNENLRAQPENLFIEDAIQETTVVTGSVSAEYGRFTGGVVNAVTKSGGNEFSGSFRTNFSNDDWVSQTPFGEEHLDEINNIYEGTLGGPIFRDRLWFFTAGRDLETDDVRETFATPGPGTIDPTPISYSHGFEESRLEGKLTGTFLQKHNLVASYMDYEETEFNHSFVDEILDLASLVPVRPEEKNLFAINYNGAWISNFFTEAQFSRRERAIIQTGANCTDLVCGTLLLDRARGGRFNSPTFRRDRPEERDNESWVLKGSYFLSTERFGSHDFRAGVEDFNEVRKVDNYQSGSDYRISVSRAIIRGTQVFGTFPNTGTLTRILWRPIFVHSRGSNYTTQSAFVNDRIHLNNHWTFNAGLRYDQNEATGGAGDKVGEDDAFSPRLAAHYDIRGDGRYIVNLSYGQYVAKLSEGIGNDGDPAGRTSNFEWNYRGPAINSNVNAPTSELVSTAQAIEQIFAWFFANGGTNMRPFRTTPSVRGIADRLDPRGLDSPNSKEYTLGFGAGLGQRGYARVDFVYRNWDDFYVEKINTEIGKVDSEFGTFDLAFISNSDLPEREYEGAQTQLSYRFSDRLYVGANYTWSRLTGNFTGENVADGPVVFNGTRFPEYREERWNYPTGYLSADQRHRARAWIGSDWKIGPGELNATLLQSYDSGTAYSADGEIDPRPFVTNPGYVTPVGDVSYFFKGGRGIFRTDDITRTDIALNFSWPLFGRLEFFLQPEVINVFDEDGVVSADSEVLTNLSDSTNFARFNPFTDTPVECPQGAPLSQCKDMGAHFQLGENFGLPVSEDSYQTPRTFRFSAGLRF